jgi:hypothetical protein
VSRLGDPRPFWHFARTWFLKPLGAPSFRAFWTYWNPVYGYVLLYFVYRPLRRYLPRSVATFLTFVVSGLLLHDLPFTISAEIVRGQAVVPSGTILLASFGALVVLSDVLHLDLSRYPRWLRIGANVGWLAAGFVLRRLIVAVWR